jgi:hypothetical protein
VNQCGHHPLNYDPLAWAKAVRRTRRLIVMVALVLPFVWLDHANVQALGWVLYPIESALNAVLFPGVTTPIRGNGTALLILAPTLALLALVFLVLRSGVTFIRRALRPFFGCAE